MTDGRDPVTGLTDAGHEAQAALTPSVADSPPAAWDSSSS
jgi:hypothetical protein